MRSIIKRVLFTVFLLNISLCSIKAANYFSISTNTTTVKVGDTVKLTVNFSSYESGLSISTSNKNILTGGAEVDWVDSGSYVTYFTAKSPGTATINVNTKNGTTMDPNNEKDMNFSRSVTITVIPNSTGGNNGGSSGNNKPIDINKTYSKNNNLSSLKIEGYDLTPEFNRDTLEYSVTLEPGTEKINISAEVEDKTATVKGVGEVEVSEGINTVEIVVTAENGNEKTYRILATVHEKDPINIKIGDNEYTVVKKKDLLPKKDGYNETTVKINDFDIPVLHNDVTDVMLVGLKDKGGNIKLYSYDTKTGKYAEYKEFKFDLMNLYIHEYKENKYKKVNIKINDTDVVAYELEGISDYYLLYATNTATGYEGYYLYDKIENSVQRYDVTMLESLTKEKDKYLSIVLVLSSVCFLTMLFLLVEVNRDSKRKSEE